MAVTLNYRELRQMLEHNSPEWLFKEIRENLDNGQLKPSDFSIRELAEATVEDGREWVQSMNPRRGAGGLTLLESSAVNTANFSNITGQIAFAEIMQAYDDPKFIGDELCTVQPTSFNGEKIPGMSRLGDAAEVVQEGADYPTVGFGESFVETPQTTKRGFIVPVTKEAIFFDLTGLILDRAREVGRWLGLNREKRILDTVLGITTSYRRNGAAAIATYGDSPFDNLAASNALVDWTDIEAAELLFDALTDPDTGEPIMCVPNTLIVPTALRKTAEIILGGQVTKVDNQANAATYRTVAGTQPVRGDQYRVLSSPLVKQRTSSASTWFVGDPKMAFVYKENWPITVVQAPTNSEAEFTSDIVVRFKASERGAAAVKEPRYMVKCTA